MAAVDRKTTKPLGLASQFSLFLLKFYQWVISPLIGPRCRFYPSCSHYACDAINQHGFLRGATLSAKRLAKCHPGHPGGIDEVPAQYSFIKPSLTTNLTTKPCLKQQPCSFQSEHKSQVNQSQVSDQS